MSEVLHGVLEARYQLVGTQDMVRLSSGEVDVEVGLPADVTGDEHHVEMLPQCIGGSGEPGWAGSENQ
jgi:hypothetical protein